MIVPWKVFNLDY